MSNPTTPPPPNDDPTPPDPPAADTTPPTNTTPADKPSDDAPTVADTVAANVDAPAEEPGKTSPDEVTAPSTASSTTSDAPADATRELPADGEKAGDTPGGETPGVVRKRRNPWPTVGTLAAVLVILAGIGYFGGLGPLNRLSTTRDLNPPEQLSGLNRITDQATRERLQLDQTRDALRRINDGKKASVEAYGEPAGDKLFMIIALRGKVDIDKEIRDSGATGDQVKKVGKSTCATSVQDIPTSCYRGSNTLTVIAQGLNDKTDVNAVGAIADEAFDAMK